MNPLADKQTCNTCSVEKPLSDYFANKRNKSGREHRCKQCTKLKNQANKEKVAESQRKWRAKNPDYAKDYQQSEKRKEYQKQYYKQHSNAYKDRKKQWRKDHPEQEAQARKAYIEKNKKEINKYHSLWKAKKRETDIYYKLKENTSRRIRYELNTLLKGKKTKRTTAYIGCTIDALKTHLEKQFTDGITWENYGSIWHIDHIIPCATWNLADEFENNCCWNYRNLQPMLASVNQSKHDNHSQEEKEKYVKEMREILGTGQT